MKHLHLFLIILFAHINLVCAPVRGETMPAVVENYIKDFEAGKSFRSPAKGLVNNKKIDSQALNALRKELATAQPEVRSQGKYC
jgi:hypothetical protein